MMKKVIRINLISNYEHFCLRYMLGFQNVNSLVLVFGWYKCYISISCKIDWEQLKVSILLKSVNEHENIFHVSVNYE